MILTEFLSDSKEYANESVLGTLLLGGAIGSISTIAIGLLGFKIHSDNRLKVVDGYVSKDSAYIIVSSVNKVKRMDDDTVIRYFIRSLEESIKIGQTKPKTLVEVKNELKNDKDGTFKKQLADKFRKEMIRSMNRNISEYAKNDKIDKIISKKYDEAKKSGKSYFENDNRKYYFD